MRVTTIHVSVARVFNLGDYNNLRLEGYAEVALDEGDDPVVARAAAMAEVRAILRDAYLANHPDAKKAKTQGASNGG